MARRTGYTDRDLANFSRNLREIRESLGLTQPEFADRYCGGAAKESISRWERGQQIAEHGILRHMASLLGISSDELLGDKVPSVKGGRWNAEVRIDGIPPDGLERDLRAVIDRYRIGDGRRLTGATRGVLNVGISDAADEPDGQSAPRSPRTESPEK